MHRSSVLRRGGAALTLGLVALASPLAVRPAAATAGNHTIPMTLRASADADGLGLERGTAPRISADGRFVAFASNATHLVGTPAVGDVRVKDLVTGDLSEVSLTAGGDLANAGAVPVGISADGRFVAFTSAATNLGGPDDGQIHLYVRDRLGSTLSQVDLSSNGNPLPVKRLDPRAATLSANGNVVAWECSCGQLFVRDLHSKVTSVLDSATGDTLSGFGSQSPTLSADGRFAAFDSSATTLVPGDTNARRDVFWRDRQTGTTRLVSTKGTPATGDSLRPSISEDGTRVAFASTAPDLSLSDTNGTTDVFVWVLGPSGATTVARVSASATGAQGDQASSEPWLSPDGRHIAFQTEAADLVPGDTNGQRDVVVRNLDTGATERVSVSTMGGQGNGPSAAGPLDRHGAVATFASVASNLVVGDTNGTLDAFVRAAQPTGPHASLAAMAGSIAADFDGSSTVVQRDLQGGRSTPTHAIARLAHAPAWAAHRAGVIRLYFAFFERFPDLAGLDFWIGQRAKGRTLSQIAAQFAQVPEFKATYGKVDDAGFVKLVYRNVLDREPDTAGLTFWVGRMALGATRGDVMTNFSESAEGKRHLAPDVDSALLGIGLLHRVPAEPLRQQAVAAQRQTGGPDAAALVYLTSTAYRSRF